VIIANRINKLGSLFLGRVAGQMYLLFSSYVVNSILLFVSTTLIARLLGSEDFGIFAFYLRITTFTLLFFGFGVSYALAVLLPHQNDKDEERKLVGAGLIMGLFIGVLYGLFIFVLSFFIDDIFRTKLGTIMRTVSPLLIAFPLQSVIHQIGRGTSRVGSIAVLNIMPFTLLLLTVIVCILTNIKSLQIVVFLHAASIAASIICISLCSKAKLGDVRENIMRILKKTKSYGVHMYIGQVADLGSAALDAIFIPLFANTTHLGFYTLARGTFAPISMMSYSLALVKFKFMATARKVPWKIELINYVWLVTSCTLLLVFGKSFVLIVFGSEYNMVGTFFFPLAAAAFFRGGYQLYNLFLVAHEKKLVGYFSLITMPINVFANYFLISRYGAYGAAMVILLTAVLWFMMYYIYYLIELKQVKRRELAEI
jgi:O-antigen/teichoic acid export membrane protein